MRTRDPSADAAELHARGWQRWWSTWTDRRRGGPAPRHVRRALAALLVVGGGILAVLPSPAGSGVAVAVTTVDLPVGSVLRGDQVRTAAVPDGPDGALAPSAVAGRILAAPVRRGEILTDARLVAQDGPTAGPGRSAVPVRLDDPGVVALLRPGLHVAVLAVSAEAPAAPAAPSTDPPADAGPSQTSTTAAEDGWVSVLADDAVVLSVPAIRDDRTIRASSTGATVLLAVPTEAADRVAAHAVLGSLTVRFT